MRAHKHSEAGILLATASIDDGPGPRQQPDPVALDSLIASVRRRGLLQPLRLAAGDRHVCVVGKRRLDAARAAGLEQVPCLLVSGEPDAGDVLEEQLAEQLLREDLRPLELARALRRLLELRPTSQRDLADRIGVSQAHVSRSLALLDDLAPGVQELVEGGELPASTAAELAGLPPEEQEAAALKIMEEETPRREVRERQKAPERAVFRFETAKGWKIQLTAPRKRATEAQAREALRAFLVEGEEEAAQAA